jgi:hypothetical protein
MFLCGENNNKIGVTHNGLKQVRFIQKKDKPKYDSDLSF